MANCDNIKISRFYRWLRASSFALLPLALFLGLSGCGGRDEQPEGDEAKTVTVVSPIRVTSGQKIQATGTLQRRKEITLSFRIGGVLVKVDADIGDKVKSGQVLARVDATQTKARLAQAQANHVKVLSDYNRDQKLFNSGYISSARMESRKALLAQARANLEATSFDQRWSRLAAPASGAILERYVRAGEVVSPGQPIYRLADDRSPWVIRLALSDRDVVLIGPDAKADVMIPALDKRRIKGRVKRIAGGASPGTGTFDVEIEIPHNPALRSGFIARVLIDRLLKEGDSTFSVPAEAVFEIEGDKAWIYTVSQDGAHAKRKSIRFLGFVGDHAHIQGIKPDDRVITFGGGLISDGRPISVTEQIR